MSFSLHLRKKLFTFEQMNKLGSWDFLEAQYGDHCHYPCYQRLCFTTKWLLEHLTLIDFSLHWRYLNVTDSSPIAFQHLCCFTNPFSPFACNKFKEFRYPPGGGCGSLCETRVSQNWVWDVLFTSRSASHPQPLCWSCPPRQLAEG